MALIIFTSFSLAEELSYPNQENALEEAKILASCAGFLSFTSKLMENLNKPYQAKENHMKSNGWRIASMGAFFVAGMNGKNVNRMVESAHEVAYVKWMAMMEREDSNLQSEVEKELSHCLSYNSSQQYYRDIMRELVKELEEQSSPSKNQ
jgi:hypothetical protein